MGCFSGFSDRMNGMDRRECSTGEAGVAGGEPRDLGNSGVRSVLYT